MTFEKPFKKYEGLWLRTPKQNVHKAINLDDQGSLIYLFRYTSVEWSGGYIYYDALELRQGWTRIFLDQAEFAIEESTYELTKPTKDELEMLFRDAHSIMDEVWKQRR